MTASGDATRSSGAFYIVCGVGRTGSTVASMLSGNGHRLVCVDNDPESLARLPESRLVETLRGDCLEDDVLRSAGVQEAEGLFATLPEDRDNVFLVLSAKRINPGIRAVSRCVDAETTRKLSMVGADRTIRQSEVEGLRLSSQLVRPDAVVFLDRLMHARADDSIRYRRIAITEGSPSAGFSIGELQLSRRTGVVIVALRKSSGRMLYSPRARQRVEAGDSLIAFASGEEEAAMVAALAEGPPGAHGRRWWKNLFRFPPGTR